MLMVLKFAIAGFVVAFASWLSKKPSRASGVITALPLVFFGGLRLKKPKGAVKLPWYIVPFRAAVIPKNAVHAYIIAILSRINQHKTI